MQMWEDPANANVCLAGQPTANSDADRTGW
jgi:hypothetical protein